MARGRSEKLAQNMCVDGGRIGKKHKREREIERRRERIGRVCSHQRHPLLPHFRDRTHIFLSTISLTVTMYGVVRSEFSREYRRASCTTIVRVRQIVKPLLIFFVLRFFFDSSIYVRIARALSK